MSLYFSAGKKFVSRSITLPISIGNLGTIRNSLGYLDSPLFTKTTLTEANVHWRECMCRLTRSTLEVPTHHMMRNVIVHYARWWHGFAEATCTAIHISMLLTVPSGRRGRGPHLARSSQRIHQFLGSILYPVAGWGGGGDGGKEERWCEENHGQETQGLPRNPRRRAIFPRSTLMWKNQRLRGRPPRKRKRARVLIDHPRME